MTIIQEKRANQSQQRCIDLIDGQVMALAGPGTGKTFTLIERIKNMLTKEILPEKILCLTFSEAAASEMKKRLTKDIGPIGSKVNVYTFHGFCNEIISNYPNIFIGFDNAKLITPTLKRNLIKQCIDEFDTKALRTEGYDAYFYINDIDKSIAEIKKQMFTKADFEKAFKNFTHKDYTVEQLKQIEEEKTLAKKKVPNYVFEGYIKIEEKIAKAKEIWTIFERYKELMQENHLIDFDDMIGFVLNKLETDADFASEISNNYDYFLVDEYQDTNKAQNSIIFALLKASQKKNIFVVGDDDQIIYAFQGAELTNLENFLEQFPDTEVVCLTENMRSTQPILDFSYEVIKSDLTRLEFNPKFKKHNITKQLTSMHPKLKDIKNPVKFWQFAELSQEQNTIIQDIENLINSDLCPTNDKGEKNLCEIAILTRSNFELLEYADKLKNKNIPFELKEGKSIFQIKGAMLLFLYLQILVKPYHNADKIFAILQNKPFAINPKDYAKLLEQKLLHKNKFFIDDMRNIPSEDFYEPEKIENFMATYDYLRNYANCETLKNTIIEIANRTGILKYFLTSQTNTLENIMSIKKLINEATELSNSTQNVSLEDFVEYLRASIANDIEIKTDKSPIPMNAIQLSTYHSSKGREFEYVYLPCLESKKWEKYIGGKGASYVPPKTLLSKEQKEELKLAELSKLLFVGITRAKKGLTISYPTKINGSDKALSELIPFDKNSFDYQEFEYDTSSFAEEKIKEIITEDYDYKSEITSYLKAKADNLSLSATSINMYKNCPKMFLFSKILELNIKESDQDAMNYGNAVHKACQKLFNNAKNNGFYPTKEEFLNFFKEEFATLQISSEKTRNDLLDRANDNLQEFYVQLSNIPVKNLYKSEYKISDFQLENVAITGFIDRIEKLDDGTYALYDYKTGKSKSHSQIVDGGTYEHYLNQLRFYKYSFEKTTGEIVSKTGIIYPEDCKKNVEKILTDEDNKIIENLIKETNNSIKSLQFNAEPKDSKTCEMCDYKLICSHTF